jgi:hypothetical protein
MGGTRDRVHVVTGADIQKKEYDADAPKTYSTFTLPRYGDLGAR